MTDITKPPKVFISYAWEDDTKIWVRKLATRLRFNGVHAILDQWDVAPGDSLPEFMEISVSASDFVLVVCTPAYKRKSDSSDPSGVGYEKGVITGELFVKRNQRKFIPILRKGRLLDAAPSWVLGKNYIDLHGNPYNENNYQELLRTLYGKRKPPPELGTPPDFSDDDDDIERPKPFAKFLATLKDNLSETFTIVKSNLSKAMPVFRLAGIIGIVIVLFWAGSWVVPKIIALVPTPQATATAPQHPVAKATSRNSPVSPTKTLKPNATPTKTQMLIPTSLPTEITDAKGVPMMLVPAGEFIMGSDEGDDDEKPRHTVYLDSFYIDKFEVTNSLYEACVNAGVCSAPAYKSQYYIDSHFHSYPVAFVDWNRANAYCNWANKKLPTEAQWEKAASWDDLKKEQRVYPWGNEFMGLEVNFCDKNCPYGGIAQIPDMSVDDGYANLAPVGSYRGGTSFYGISDMAGNVLEWVNDWYDSDYYSNSPVSNPVGSDTGESHVHRGGSWSDGPETLRSANRIIWIPESTIIEQFGFRCAKIADS